jgi:hypothetical protein
MSAMGNADASEDATSEDAEEPGLWTSFGTALRLIVGWFCVAIGALNLLVEMDRPSGISDGPYLIFHAVWLVGGVVLLALASIAPNPGLPGYLIGALVTAAGMIISAVPATTTVCCLSSFSVRHGYPFVFLARNVGTGDAGRWHFDNQHALADLMFWAYLGLISLIVASLFRRSPEPADEQAPDAAAGPESGSESSADRQYIEHRGHTKDEAQPKSVGPLP